MTEPERIKNIEERITLARLLPGVNLDCLPPEESAKLKRAALDLYRLGHASGFQAGADHATNAAAGVIPPRHIALQTQILRRLLTALALAGLKKIAALNPSDSYQKPAAMRLSD